MLIKIDLSHNAISKMDGLAALVRLMSCDLTANRITTIPKLPRLRSLQSLHLAGNRIAALTEIANLRALPSLSSVTLEGNPVAESPNSRAFAIHSSPSLDSVNGEAVCVEERQEASERFARGECTSRLHCGGCAAFPLSVGDSPACPLVTHAHNLSTEMLLHQPRPTPTAHTANQAQKPH